MTAEDHALLRLLERLDRLGYHFVTPTPATHARVLARRGKAEAADLADVLGWSVPFRPGVIDPEVERTLLEAGMIDRADGLLRAHLRVSSLHGRPHVHSAYPTEAEDAVFFGPDTYRFVDFVLAEFGICSAAPNRIADVCTGAGAGAIAAAIGCPGAQVVATDINPAALRFARLNAIHAGVSIEPVEGPGLDTVAGAFDVVLANPPYIVDEGGRQYRDGGDMHGGRLSLDLAVEAVERLAPGGRLLLYTGSAIVHGHDALGEALHRHARERGCTIRYRELDPDVFGEELEQPAYADVDRIALVAAVIEVARK